MKKLIEEIECLIKKGEKGIGTIEVKGEQDDAPKPKPKPKPKK